MESHVGEQMAMDERGAKRGLPWRAVALESLTNPSANITPMVWKTSLYAGESVGKPDPVDHIC